MAIYPKATSELNIFNDDDGDAISPPDFMINSGTGQKTLLGTEFCFRLGFYSGPFSLGLNFDG